MPYGCGRWSRTTIYRCKAYCAAVTPSRDMSEENAEELIREPAQGYHSSENQKALNVAADLLQAEQILVDGCKNIGIIRAFNHLNNRGNIFHASPHEKHQSINTRHLAYSFTHSSNHQSQRPGRNFFIQRPPRTPFQGQGGRTPREGGTGARHRPKRRSNA